MAEYRCARENPKNQANISLSRCFNSPDQNFMFAYLTFIFSLLIQKIHHHLPSKSTTFSLSTLLSVSYRLSTGFTFFSRLGVRKDGKMREFKVPFDFLLHFDLTSISWSFFGFYKSHQTATIPHKNNIILSIGQST